jgi:hypothetical protein
VQLNTKTKQEQENKMSKNSKLHELLAVFADTTNAAQAIQNETVNTFAKKADHFRGQTRTVKFFEDGREGENTVDTKEVVTTVHEKLEHASKILGRHYDALLQLEDGNSRAKADVVIDGTVLVADAPATFLLGMENRLKNLRDVFAAIPTLEPSVKWEANAASGGRIFDAPPATTFKTEKTLKSRVLYEATKEHPAQIQQWNEDVPVARIETSHVSGMITPLDKSLMLGRVDKLLSAVKKARQRANAVEVNNRHVAKDFFDYIIGQ